ncbi:MAG: cytochrome c-type biogenesis protein CcmH [Gemmatimonadota bacterium]|nr:MAG: cytochrome c-type biogenesis protein CcmH [Gemmatimonadota bacterium]
MRSERRYTRRDVVKLSVAALLPGALLQGEAPAQGDTAVGQLLRPDLAGRPRGRVTDYQNDPFIVGIEGQLRCTCGCNLDVYTCRTTDFTCATSPAMHRELVGMLERGMTGEQILEAFVAQHGETVLMAPKKEGFNLAAYFVPGAAILTVGSALLWVLFRRSASAPELAAAGASERPTDLSAEEHAKLESELGRLE